MISDNLRYSEMHVQGKEDDIGKMQNTTLMRSEVNNTFNQKDKIETQEQFELEKMLQQQEYYQQRNKLLQTIMYKGVIDNMHLLKWIILL